MVQDWCRVWIHDRNECKITYSSYQFRPFCPSLILLIHPHLIFLHLLGNASFLRASTFVFTNNSFFLSIGTPNAVRRTTAVRGAADNRAAVFVFLACLDPLGTGRAFEKRASVHANEESTTRLFVKSVPKHSVWPAYRRLGTPRGQSRTLDR